VPSGVSGSASGASGASFGTGSASGASGVPSGVSGLSSGVSFPSASAHVSASAVASPAIAGRLYRVTGAGAIGLAVRTGPSIAQTKLGVVHDGEIIAVLSQSAGWGQVRGDGFSGYSSMAYLVAAPTGTAQALAKLSPSPTQ
jgi:hypothetical protein